MREAVNFLRTIYANSIPDVARIIVAEAENDTEIIKKYLTTARDYTDKLINKL